MNRNSSNLTSVGSEIITNISSPRSFLFSSRKNAKKIITKSYNISNDLSQPDPDSYNKENNNNKQNESNSMLHSQNKNVVDEQKHRKEKTTLDLSNIKYKDGYILKDAANSNPGFGLWSVKPQNNEEKNSLFLNEKEESKTNKCNSNENELNYRYTTYKETIENNIRNKKIIDKLSNKLNDLEKKYMKALSNYQEKKYLCQNAIRKKNEYDQLYNENNNEIELIKNKSEQINSENKILENALSNTRNEINRLLNIVKEDKENMNKLREEYDKRLKKEEIERNKLNDIIKMNEEKIETLNEKNNELDNKDKEKLVGLYNLYMENELYDNEHKKDFQIKVLKDMALNLQIKICNLKKEKNNNNKEIEELDKALKYNNLKDEYQKIKINSLFYTVEENEIISKRNNNVLENKNQIINNLNLNFKNNVRNKINIKKINKCSSQILSINKNVYDLKE